jgi:hypothetical protein
VSDDDAEWRGRVEELLERHGERIVDLYIKARDEKDMMDPVVVILAGREGDSSVWVGPRLVVNHVESSLGAPTPEEMEKPRTFCLQENLIPIMVYVDDPNGKGSDLTICSCDLDVWLEDEDES